MKTETFFMEEKIDFNSLLDKSITQQTNNLYELITICSQGYCYTFTPFLCVFY